LQIGPPLIAPALPGALTRYVGRILKGEKPADLPVQQHGQIRGRQQSRLPKALGLTHPGSETTRQHAAARASA
jgi:hypothetical protein